MGEKDSSTKRRSSLTTPNEDTKTDGTIIMQTRESKAVKKIHAALIIIEGAEIGKQFFLRRSLYTIGRSGDVEI
ncbi:MAG: hypothetical protein JRI49_07435, partial [Deltaproteobacteria bacterium]|nr:hypothetical protein [Deltaproteobacteria bacterium]